MGERKMRTHQCQHPGLFWKLIFSSGLINVGILFCFVFEQEIFKIYENELDFANKMCQNGNKCYALNSVPSYTASRVARAHNYTPILSFIKQQQQQSNVFHVKTSSILFSIISVWHIWHRNIRCLQYHDILLWTVQFCKLFNFHSKTLWNWKVTLSTLLSEIL